MLEIKNLCLHYKQSQILFDVNLIAVQGEVTCIMGTNGVGKTSLLRAVSGTVQYQLSNMLQQDSCCDPWH